jgi:hypothetical protein
MADDSLFRLGDKRNYLPLLLISAVMAAAATSEYLQGRVIWCRAGDLVPWSWDIWSTHNSQHLFDPYSFTHILHGVFEFWLIGLIFKRVPIIWRLVIAVAIEGSWEIAENTSYVINRYREATISLDYYGDSIINSMSDIACCGLGFLIAYKIRFWWSVALFVFVEALLIVTIHDSLIINVIMLIYPSDAIKHWQMGG